MPCTTNMMSRANRLILLLLVLVLLPLSGQATNPEDSLLLGLTSVTTQRLNPFTSVEREMMSLTALIYEGLVQIDDDYNPRPCLAERWESSSDGRTWYFTLREGLTFHDGSPLTASDVVASAHEIKRLVDDETVTSKGPYTSLRYFIDDIQSNDNLTVVIRTSRPNYGFLYAMTFPVVPQAQVGADNPPGTGPYIADAFVPKDYMLLSKNPLWWNGSVTVGQIMTIFHATNRDLISSYEYNRVDAILTRSLTAAQYRSGMNSFNLTYRTRQLETLMMNNRSVELNDILVRKAIRHAINLNAITSTTYMNMAARTDTLMPVGTWMYNENAGRHEYNPDLAREMLDAAGWIDGDDEDTIREKMIDGKKRNLVLRFFVYEEQENSVRLSTAHQIAGMLADVGIHANVKAMSFTQAREALKSGSFDLCLAAFQMDVAPDPGFLLMRGNTGNYSRYQSTEMDELFKSLRSATKREDYQMLLYQIQSRFFEDCPFISLYYRSGAVLTRKMFTNARDMREPEVLRGIAESRRSAGE